MPQATPGAASEVVRFDEFEADLQSGELRKAGRRIKLQHQPFQLLRVLLERPGELISREELQRRLWPDGTIVEFDHSVNTALKKIRQALGDPAGSPRFIETVPRRGYRFITPVSNGRRDMPGVAALARRQILFRFRLLIATVGVLAGTYWLLRPADDARHEPVIVQLTSYPTLEKHPSLSPDGNQVAFSWNGPEGDNFDIYVKQVDGQIPLRLTTDPDSDVEPAWSPDGRWIAFQRPSVGIFLVSPLGGRERKVAEVGTEPSWTPDSKSLVFIAGGLPDRPQAVFQIAIATGERKQLTFPPRGYWGDAHPAVSPDSKTLAFTRTRQPGVSELLLQPLAGGEARPAMQEVARIAGLAWTPDGNEIIFASDRRGASRLWRVVPDGRPRPVVAVGDPASSPALSRAESGRAVLLVYERSFAATDVHLTTLNDNGRAGALQSKPLIESTRQEWHPRFSANGTKIAFTSDRAGTAQVWTCERDGSNCTQ
jgi:Tol biopolymer transport system component/DNA-binding winged helix-turn-helix (wHTH) protein